MLRLLTAGLLAAIACAPTLAQIPARACAEDPGDLSHDIEVDTSKTKGNTQRVARYLADELLAAGFAEEDVRIVPRVISRR
jgi:chitodextrinase